jgi:hypothetical protein
VIRFFDQPIAGLDGFAWSLCAVTLVAALLIVFWPLPRSKL